MAVFLTGGICHDQIQRVISTVNLNISLLVSESFSGQIVTSIGN